MTPSERISPPVEDHSFTLVDRKRHVAPLIALLLAGGYTLLFFVQTPDSWGTTLRQGLGPPKRILMDGIRAGVEALALFPTREIVHGVYLTVVSLVIPWTVLAALRRGRPRDWGLRRPNRMGPRLLAVGTVVSLPFLFWMVNSPSFAPYYLPQWDRAGSAAFLVYYLVAMIGEHAYLHGMILAVLRRGGRWPEASPVVETGATRATRRLQWFGLAQPTEGARGRRRITRWWGLPDGCLPAVVGSALLFGAVHLGKDAREAWLSLPGGAALAYLAYRANSWLIPLLLHLITAGLACGMMLFFES